MGRRKKTTSEITIHSKETRIILGLLLLLGALTLIAAPFSTEAVFQPITYYLGVPSVAWGILLLLIAIRVIKGSSRYANWRTITGTLIIAMLLNILFTFWIPPELLNSLTDFSNEGGWLGYMLHGELHTFFGSFIEFVLIIVSMVVAFSLISGVSLEQIESSISSFLDKIFESRNKLKLSKGDEEDISIVDSMLKKDDKDEDDYEPEIQNGAEAEEKELAAQTHMTSAVEKQFKDVADKKYVGEGNKTTGGSSEDDDKGTLIEPQYPNWKFPPTSLLQKPHVNPQDPNLHKRNASVIEKTLRSFNIESRISKVTIGPTVVQYALSITVGTKVAKVRNLTNDIALALATSESQIRIEAPIPGTSLIGIEIPNPTPNFVFIRELVERLNEEHDKYKLPVILGKNVAGQPIIKDLSGLPHLLVAGATGTGKSVGINSILTGLLMTKSPDELKLILVDPKMVEMAPYNGIPHLLTPVITDMELVVNALQWTVEEMLKRYRILKQIGARNIVEYNDKTGDLTMPYIVLVIDEMADLMLTTGVDVESKIVRLAQMARAVGIHLILATQRPSVDVITGLIKANVPGRIAFSVSTSIDSRVILDQTGAETLIGKGDMMFKSPSTGRPIRMQGAWTDTVDTEAIIDFIKDQTKELKYTDAVIQSKEDKGSSDNSSGGHSDDEMFEDALEVVINAQKASASLLQRRLRIGYNRAARLIDELHEAGAIGPQDGSSPRKVLVTSREQILGGGSDEGTGVEEEIFDDDNQDPPTF